MHEQNAPTAHHTPAAALAAGTYTWQRPGVLCTVAAAAGLVVASVYTPTLGAQQVPAEVAVPALLAALAQVPVQFQPAPVVPVVTLTRQRARAMHKALAALGLPATDRYELAARLVGRPVESLTALTEQEARAVWVEATAQAAQVQAARSTSSAPALDASEEEQRAYAEELLR